MESENIKIAIHKLQKEINEVMTSDVRDKLERLVSKMDKLISKLEDEKPHRYYYRQWKLEQAQKAYYHLLSDNRD